MHCFLTCKVTQVEHMPLLMPNAYLLQSKFAITCVLLGNAERDSKATFSNETSKLASSLLSAESVQETYTVLPFQAQSSQKAVCLAMHGYEAISFSHNNLFGQICPLCKFEQGGYQGFVVCTAASSHID